MVGIYLNHELTDERRREKIFGGEILLYTQVNATASLADYAIGMITDALAPYEPQHAQFSLPVDRFIQRIGPLKTRFTNDPHTKVLVRDVLDSFGCDLRDTYFDVPRLRVVRMGIISPPG